MTDVIQSVLDDANRRGVASVNAGQIDPNGPIGQAILAQSQQRDQRTLAGPPNSLWTSGKGPDSFANADSRAFQRAGDEFGRGNYAAGVGNALTGAVAAVPAAVYDGGASALRGIGAPLAAAHSAIGAGAQAIAPQVSEFARGLTGGAPPPTNADVVMAAIKGPPQGAPPAPASLALTDLPPLSKFEPEASQKPEALDHTNSFGITPEMLSKMPKVHADMIRGAGGISMGHLMQLMQMNAPLNTAAETSRAAYTRHSQDLAQLGIDYGVTVGKDGTVNIPENLLKKSSDNVEEVKRQQLVEGLRSRALYAYHGAQIHSPAWNQLNAIPGMGGQ